MGSRIIPHSSVSSSKKPGATHRLYFDSLAKKLGIKEQPEWYKVSRNTFIKSETKAKALLDQYYGGSLVSALSRVYPEFKWHRFLFANPPVNYWKHPKHQRECLDSVAEEFGIEVKEGWHGIFSSDVSQSQAGANLMKHWNGSLLHALRSGYPVPRGYWNDRDNQRACTDWLAEQLGVHVQEDWYDVTVDDMRLHYASGLVSYHDDSIVNVLKHVYPQYEWYEWLFLQSPRNFWDDVANHRKFFDWYASVNNMTSLDDWYNVSVSDIMQSEGATVLIAYKKSLVKALSAAYPEHDWKVWMFQHTPKRYWTDPVHQKQFLDHLAEKFRIQTPIQWNRISQKVLKREGGAALLYHYGTFDNALQAVYPELEWGDAKKCSLEQTTLWNTLQSIPEVKDEVLLNYKHPGLIRTESQRPMELDFYIPSLKLAIEYQGGHHYEEKGSTHSQGVVYQQQKDMEKKIGCEKLGITLVQIPFWWDGSEEAVISTILKHRPDLSIYFDKVLNHIHRIKATSREF